MNDGNWRSEFGQSNQNRTQNSFFCHFLKFVSLVFLEIAYNDAAIHLEEVKITKFFLGSNVGQNRARNWVFTHFPKFGSLVFPEIEYNDSFQ